MKLLVISHSSVISAYQDRFVEVTRHPDIKLTLLVPKKWQEYNRWVSLGKSSNSHYRIIPRQPLCWGLKSPRLRNVTHIYSGMRKLLKEIQPEIIELWEEPFSAVTAHAIRMVRKMFPPAKIIFFSAQNILKKYPPPFAWFEKYTYKYADFAFVMNGEAGKIIRKKGWKKESLVLPLGVNPETFKKLDASALKRKLALDGFTVGFIGKFDRQKGVPDLIRACAKLPGKVNLLMIGQGPLEAEIKQLIGKLGLESATRIIPSVPHKELPLHLNCMDVLVLPSITLPGLKEQFGRVLIEAMSCGVPVIGSDSGEIPNVIGDAGLIFPENKTDQLTDRLQAIINNPALRQELSARGRERVMLNYSWEKIAQKQIGVYERLMDR